eukprot:TRINITY_DN5228_c0_g1_i6.p1 TRINITY_DN5228_c0_g1~~TRINITY_DN5228_c0_g1_i6.p1  ORF type:complete len:175 (+),score=8.60 TRINITY_DN5228_c0_g1_i6:112-636(+)
MNSKACPVKRNCEVGSWSAWSRCSKPCGNGTECIRARQVLTSAAKTAEVLALRLKTHCLAIRRRAQSAALLGHMVCVVKLYIAVWGRPSDQTAVSNGFTSNRRCSGPGLVRGFVLQHTRGARSIVFVLQAIGRNWTSLPFLWYWPACAHYGAALVPAKNGGTACPALDRGSHLL